MAVILELAGCMVDAHSDLEMGTYEGGSQIVVNNAPDLELFCRIN